MDEENKNGQNSDEKNEQNSEPQTLQNNGSQKYEGMLYAFIAAGLILAGAVALGLSFTKLGIYSLIASMLFEISAMTFINLQKKKNDLKWLIYLRIAAYAFFIAALFLFAGGTIWASQK